jgi:hypothetical protein
VTATLPTKNISSLLKLECLLVKRNQLFPLYSSCTTTNEETEYLFNGF